MVQNNTTGYCLVLTVLENDKQKNLGKGLDKVALEAVRRISA